MVINETGGVQGPQPIQPSRVNKPFSPQSPSSRAERTDEAEISQEARLLDKLRKVPGIREERVAELQKLIEEGRFETKERVRGAIDRLFEENLG